MTQQQLLQLPAPLSDLRYIVVRVCVAFFFLGCLPPSLSLQSGTVAFSYGIQHVQDTIGVRALFWKLSINQRRKSHKPFCGDLCDAGLGGAACTAGSGCRFIHVSVAGLARRRPWNRRVGIVTTPDADWLLKVCVCVCLLPHIRSGFPHPTGRPGKEWRRRRRTLQDPVVTICSRIRPLPRHGQVWHAPPVQRKKNTSRCHRTQDDAFIHNIPLLIDDDDVC